MTMRTLMRSKYRTTYMFSATMPAGVERLARKYSRNPVVVNIGTTGKATDLVIQRVIMMKETNKMFTLKKLLDELGAKSAIVFVNKKEVADVVAKALDIEGYRVTTLHGGMLQEQRETSLEGFKTKRYNVLVATGVAGRGLDIPGVAHVINHDMPNKIEAYLHTSYWKNRSCTTFLTLHDAEVFYDPRQVLMQRKSHVPPVLARHRASMFKPGSVPDLPNRQNDRVYVH